MVRETAGRKRGITCIRQKFIYVATVALFTVAFLLNCYQELLIGGHGSLMFLGALATLAGSLALLSIFCYAVNRKRDPMTKARGWLAVAVLTVAVSAMPIARG
jgi:uncharacterized membrane protein YhaH (DUF805 family)